MSDISDNNLPLTALFLFFSSLKQWHIKGLSWMYWGVISTGVEQVDLLPTEICLQRVEQLQNNRAPAAWVTAVEAPEQEGKVPLLQGPRGGSGGGAQPCWKFPPLATSGGQRWKLHKRPSVTCEFYFLSGVFLSGVFFFLLLISLLFSYLKVPPIDAVEGLEEFAGVRDFILPQNYSTHNHNQTSVREKKKERCSFFLFVCFWEINIQEVLFLLFL